MKNIICSLFLVAVLMASGFAFAQDTEAPSVPASEAPAVLVLPTVEVVYPQGDYPLVAGNHVGVTVDIENFPGWKEGVVSVKGLLYQVADNGVNLYVGTVFESYQGIEGFNWYDALLPRTLAAGNYVIAAQLTYALPGETFFRMTQDSSAQFQVVLPPEITGTYPAYIAPGSTVTMTGNNLGAYTYVIISELVEDGDKGGASFGFYAQTEKDNGLISFTLPTRLIGWSGGSGGDGAGIGLVEGPVAATPPGPTFPLVETGKTYKVQVQNPFGGQDVTYITIVSPFIHFDRLAGKVVNAGDTVEVDVTGLGIQAAYAKINWQIENGTASAFVNNSNSTVFLDGDSQTLSHIIGEKSAGGWYWFSLELDGKEVIESDRFFVKKAVEPLEVLLTADDPVVTEGSGTTFRWLIKGGEAPYGLQLTGVGGEKGLDGNSESAGLPGTGLKTVSLKVGSSDGQVVTAHCKVFVQPAPIVVPEQSEPTNTFTLNDNGFGLKYFTWDALLLGKAGYSASAKQQRNPKAPIILKITPRPDLKVIYSSPPPSSKN